ncbi:MAG: PAS domain S-box protein, partial [candidate division WOR-3 bacterium]
MRTSGFRWCASHLNPSDPSVMTRILLVEDSPGDARLVKEALREGAIPEHELVSVETLAAARAVLAQHGFDVVLLDLSLPDSYGLDTVRQVVAAAPDTTVIVMTGLDDEVMAVESLRAGAQDYLLKGEISGHLLGRSIRYALERGRTARELREALRRRRELEEIVRQSPVIVFLWREEPGSPVEFVSDNVAQFGYSSTDFLSGQVRYQDIIHPEDLPRVRAEVDEQLRLGRNSFALEYRILTKSGEVRYVEDRTWIPVSDSDQGVRYHQGVIIDQTAHKLAQLALAESEERYRDLLDSASDLIQSVRPDGHFAFVNRAWRETLGYTPDEVADLKLADVVAPECLEHCQEKLSVVLRGQRLSQVEATFVAKDGRRILVEGNVDCRTRDGRPIATLGIFRDITERKQQELRLMQKNAELQRLNEQKNQFLGMAAHDLRNPLAVILNYSEFLLSDQTHALTPEQTRFIQAIKRSSDFMLGLINDLLDVSKIEAGKVALDLKPVVISDLVRQKVGLSGVMAARKGIHLLLDTRSDVPPTL